jgi:serine/threonine-protein kinase
MSPSPSLVELPFDQEIQRLTTDFVGREWIFGEINQWMNTSDETFLLLTGEAGIGKSATAARLIQTRDDIVAYNFCMSGRNTTVVPGTVLR